MHKTILSLFLRHNRNNENREAPPACTFWNLYSAVRGSFGLPLVQWKSRLFLI
jgi:hypothetical protein